MSGASVEYIRKLVACPELSESEIQIALTAAGADELLPDGNRKLAQLGLGATAFLIDCGVAFLALSRDFTSKLKFRVNGTQHRADVAKRAGIDKHLKFDCRPGAHSSGVLALATSALIGSIYLRKKCLVSVTKGLYSLGVLNQDVDEINLREIFTDQQGDLLPIPLDRSDPARTKETEFLGQESPPVLDFPTPADLGCFSDFERFYNETGRLKEDISDMLRFTNPGSQSPFHEDSGRQVEGGQISEISDFVAHPDVHQRNLHEAEISPQRAGQHAPPAVDFHIMVNQHSSSRHFPGKRKSSGSTGEKKRKPNCVDVEFRSLLCREAEMTRVQGLPRPEATYFRPEIEDKLLDLGSDTFSCLCIFSLQVGSSRSLVGLRAALQYARETGGQPHSVKDRGWFSRDLSATERLQIIEEIHDNTVFLQILRYNHIVHLYRCTERPVGCTSNFVIEAASHDELIGQPRARGNPKKMEVATAVNKWMKNIFPGLDPDSKTYTSKRRKILGVRKLGKRLNILAECFGDAILSLLHFDRSADMASLVTVEKIILTPTDEVFETFVKILEQSQGNFLREISCAAKSAFEHLIYEDKRQRNPFALEEMAPDDILKIPKGSQEFQSVLAQSDFFQGGVTHYSV